MPTEKIYDIIGIGIGPFNLGCAALCHEIPELNCLFIDKNESFNWHPGLMLNSARLQVPFYADLVTLANPQSRFTYMAFLKAKRRMFRFAIGECYFIRRSEFNEYCRWVADQLESLHFATECVSIEKEGRFYCVRTSKGDYLAQKIILGTGTVPFIPSFAKTTNPKVLHSADYCYLKDMIKMEPSVTIIGSGQSAAEIFYDLLDDYEGEIHWFTRSERFIPMDYSKLTLEMSTPDYIDHFYNIPDRKKMQKLNNQASLYKGINHSLINDIYDRLVEKDSDKIHLHTNCELNKMSGLTLTFLHTELEKTFVHEAGAVILATGYAPVLPACIKPIRHLLQFDQSGAYKANRNYSIDSSNSIFIQNAEMPTHGFNASDLSLGPYRNSVILNTILGREHFTIETNITFQSFGLPINQRTSGS